MKLITKLRKKTSQLSLRKTLRKFYLYILLLCQPLDGILTYMGVIRWGTIAEGNPIVKMAIEHFGVITALVFLKSISAIIAVLLLVKSDFFFSKNKNFSDCLLILVTLLYIIAVVTWIYILFGATNVTFG